SIKVTRKNRPMPMAIMDSNLPELHRIGSWYVLAVFKRDLVDQNPSILPVFFLPGQNLRFSQVV
ncbi:MAG: hypothetical protein ACKN9S_15940, partial [Pirellula sp.]